MDREVVATPTGEREKPRIAAEFDASARIARFVGSGELESVDLLTAMGRYADTPGLVSGCGAVWDFRGASLHVSLEEVEHIARVHGREGTPEVRRGARVAMLVATETDRVIVVECRAAAGLGNELRFFDNAAEATAWAAASLDAGTADT